MTKNEKRRTFARKALKAYEAAKHENESKYDVEAVITDLITDLLHLSHQLYLGRKINTAPRSIVERAINHLEEETQLS